MSRSIDELAVELVLLREKRPPLGSHYPGTLEEKQVHIEIYRNHMHEEYVLEQEIYRRVGIDNGIAKLGQVRESLALLTP